MMLALFSFSCLKSSQVTAIRTLSMNSVQTTKISALLQAPEALQLYSSSLKSSSNNIKFVDGSWYLNKGTRNPKLEYEQQRIPNASYFDIDDICDKSNPLPHMLPSPEQFSRQMTELGISNSDHVIVYVKPESFSGPRVWWMFNVYGHKKVSLLNGGIAAWIKAGGPVESEESCQSKGSKPTQDPFRAQYDATLVEDWQGTLKAVNEGSSQIADARSEARFLGQAPEPRAGVAGGHMPGSLSLPFTSLVLSDDVTTFKILREIEQVFDDAGVVVGARTVTSCGSGVSAAVLSMGHYLIRNDLQKVPIYDGSWSEWGSRGDLPKINPAAV